METSLSTSEKPEGIIALAVNTALSIARKPNKKDYPKDSTFCAIFSIHQEKELETLKNLPRVRILFESARAINTNYPVTIWEPTTYLPNGQTIFGNIIPKDKRQYLPRNTVVVFEIDEKQSTTV